MPQELAARDDRPQTRFVTCTDPSTPNRSETAIREGISTPAADPIGLALGGILAGLIALLLLASVLLPSLHVSGGAARNADASHGMRGDVSVVSASHLSAHDAGTQLSMGMIDLDDSFGSVAGLRTPRACAPHPERTDMSRYAAAFETQGAARLERPPRASAGA